MANFVFACREYHYFFFLAVKQNWTVPEEIICSLFPLKPPLATGKSLVTGKLHLLFQRLFCPTEKGNDFCAETSLSLVFPLTPVA